MPAADHVAALTNLKHRSFTAGLIASFEWRHTSLGPLEDWPEHLTTPVGVMLHAPLPMAILWGPDGLLLYNDAYAAVAGPRHPGILGLPVLEAWPEAADFSDNVLRRVLGGDALCYENMAFNLHGVTSCIWMTLYYSALPGADGKPAGVLALVQDTTEAVASKIVWARSASGSLGCSTSRRAS